MANSFDMLLTVSNQHVPNHIGHNSKYSSSKDGSVVHPGTGNKIEGWKWDQARWPSYSELSDYSYIPVVFDNGDHFSEYLYQSGYGYDEDIKMKDCTVVTRPAYSSGSVEYHHKEFWVPEVNTGNYYIFDKGWYLFSDQYVTEQLTISSDGIGAGEHSLEYVPKDDPVTPVFVRRFARNEETSRLHIVKELKQHIHTGQAPEFILPAFNVADLTISDFYLDLYTDPSAPKIITVPSLANEATTETFTLTEETREIALVSFPTDVTSLTADGTVIFDTNTSIPAGWSIDNDLGNIVVPEDHGVSELVVAYKETYSVIYEPSFAGETVSALSGNVNPLHNGINRGFVQITTEILEPYTIELTSDLVPEPIPNNLTYPLELGNNTGKLIAKVKNKVGTLLEGIRVYFEWGAPEDLSSVTDFNGEAFMFYSSPNKLDEIGEYFPVPPLPSPGDPGVDFVSQEIPPGTNLEEIWIFALSHTDEFFGLKNQTAVDTYYTNYLNAEGLDADADAEIGYRKYRFPDLDNPATKPIAIASLNGGAGDLTKGRKKLVMKLETESVYINSFNETRASESNPVWWPVHPITYDAGGVVRYHVDDIPTNVEELNSYSVSYTHLTLPTKA